MSRPKFLGRTALLTLLLAAGWVAPVRATVDLPDFAELSSRLKPAVVNISTAKTVRPRTPVMPGPGSPYGDLFEEFFERFFQGSPGLPHTQRSLGSGFLISADGYILTNAHVVEKADEVSVRLSDGRVFEATVKGTDPKLDLALLQIEADEDLPHARLGDSEALRVGEWVMAIGNPFGLEHTVTVGIVSAKGRVIGAGPYDDFIQTDASINPGNSGGPLFNIEGEVVGINTAIVAGGQGIGFAIPVNAAKSIVPQLREAGFVTRGWLGVSVQQVSPELARSFGLEKNRGALVAEVIEGSPADRAGFRRGDIILEFGGTPIEEMTDLPRTVAATPVGKEVEVEIFRAGKARTLEVEIGRLEEEAGKPVAAATGERLGLAVSDVTPDARRLYRLESDRGALVTELDPAGPAAGANLRPGDLILEVNGEETPTAASFRGAVTDAREGEILRLLVQRGESLFYTTLAVR